MSIINKAMSFARSPQGKQTISRLAASRSGGTTSRGRAGGRRSAPAQSGLAGIVSRVAGGAGRGRRSR